MKERALDPAQFRKSEHIRALVSGIIQGLSIRAGVLCRTTVVRLNREPGTSERLERVEINYARIIGRSYPTFNPVPSEMQLQAFARAIALKGQHL